MRYLLSRMRPGTRQPRRIAPLAASMTLLAISLGLAPLPARGDMFQNVGAVVFGDDAHSASVTPYPASPVSGNPTVPAGQSSSINTGLAAFSAANPANGTGPSGQGWTFTWAGAAAEAKVEAGITVLDYYPFVVTPPKVTDAAGNVYAAGAAGELGGAVFNLKYTPQAGAPAINNLHWIQALTGTRRGAAVPTILDNDPAQAYTAQNNVSPFYDTLGAAGTLAGGGGYFFDRPLINENEYEGIPVASIQFAVILADDTQTVVGGVTQNAVTLYGGENWGFTYSAVETPEPSTFVLMALGGGTLLVYRRMASRKRAA